MWCYRRIKWVEIVINAKVLKKIGGEEPTLLNWIKGIKRKFIQERKDDNRIIEPSQLLVQESYVESPLERRKREAVF